MRSALGLLLIGALAFPSPARAVPPVVKWSREAAPWAPALLQVTERHSTARKVRVRIYADSEYRTNVLRWQDRARGMLDDLNTLVGPTFGVRFEAESLRRWDETPAGMTTDAALALLEAKDRGEDVDWVIGFIAPLPLLTDSFHHTGMARELGRHFVMRGMADVAEAKAIKGLGLAADEAEKLYAARKWHKEMAVFLHEWGHTVGAIHSNDVVNVMNPRHSHKTQMFSPEQMKAMDLALACRLGQPAVLAWRCQPLLAYLETMTTSDWYAEDRQRALQMLRDGLKGHGPDGPQPSDPTISAGQLRSWNAVRTRVDEARAAQTAGEPAQAMKALGYAVEQALTLPPDGGPPVWLAIARRYQALGAISRAEEALSHAGNEPGTGPARAELQRSRRLYGLPCKSVGPGSEADFARAFDAVLKEPARSREAAIARALQSFPEAPGLLMLRCEAHLRARRTRPAEQSCRAALEAAPELARAHFLLGELDSGRKRPADAVAHLRRALELDPLAYEHWSSLSALYRTTGKTKELEELGAEYERRFRQKLP